MLDQLDLSGIDVLIFIDEHVERDGLFPTRVEAHPFRFEELLERSHSFDGATLICCGVDNNPTRRAVCQYAIDHNKPAIYAAVSRGEVQGLGRRIITQRAGIRLVVGEGSE